MQPKVAVIGAGYWGKNLVRNFAELGALSIVCESSPENQKYIWEQNYDTDIRITEEYESVINDPNIDGVVISTPAVIHYDMALKALEHGKDVYVEKPLSLNESEAQELCELADKKGQVLMVGHLLHYHPAVIKLKEIIRNGELGKLHHIYSHRLNLGKLRSEENVLWSFAPHDISIINWITGKIPEKVMAAGTASLRENIYDTVNAHLSYGDNLGASIFVSWLHPFKEQRLVIVGDKGMLVFDDIKKEDKLTWYDAPVVWNDYVPEVNKSHGTSVEYGEDEPLKNECRQFLESISNRKAPVTDGWEGLRTLKVLQGLQESMDNNGEWKTVNESHYFAHETAVIDQPCTIGKGTRIWHFSHVMKNAQIGEECNIGQNVVVSPEVVLGRNVKVQDNVSIYTGVICEDDVFLGPSMVFTNIKNPRSHIPRRDQYEKTIVRRGATIGANATIVCGVEIGEYAMVGAGAVVTKDVPSQALVVGNPARQVGWVCQCGNRVEEGKYCVECGNNVKRNINIR